MFVSIHIVYILLQKLILASWQLLELTLLELKHTHTHTLKNHTLISSASFLHLKGLSFQNQYNFDN